MTYLDTHVVVWLYDGREEKFTSRAKKVINQRDLYISPVIRLELQYLYEIKREKDEPEKILSEVSKLTGLKQVEHGMGQVVDVAMRYRWTRDPFDRLIVSEAAVDDAKLVTADRLIRKHYKRSVW